MRQGTTTLSHSKSAKEILGIMDALDFNEVARYFDRDDDEIEPYVVCDGVSIHAFNKYIGDGEGLHLALRFLYLSEAGRLMIVDLPTTVHNCTAHEFTYEFLDAMGNRHEIAQCGSMTARKRAYPKKEADATFGPMRSTRNRTPPPASRTVTDWLTLAVEVGRYQTWASLETAAQWWCNYSGIQYIVLLKMNSTGSQMRYALYDIATIGTLPVPSTSGTFQQHKTAQPVNVSFDMHRILSIPPNEALPPGVNPTATVNLRSIMDLVIESI